MKSDISLPRNPDIEISMTAQSWVEILSAAETCAAAERPQDPRLIATVALAKMRYLLALALNSA